MHLLPNYTTFLFMYIKKQKNKLTHPKCVNSAHQLLVGCGNFLLNVMVKAWLYSHELGDGRKVIHSF